MRGATGQIEKRGAQLVIVGSGSPESARAFREDLELESRILLDPELVSYRAAELRRGRLQLLSPRLPLNAIRAARRGFRQGRVQGDPFQLGGVLVIGRGGERLFQHRSREAGDHPPISSILSALDGGAPGSNSTPRSRVRGLLGEALSLVLDPTVVLSFGRTGYCAHALAFRPDDLAVDLAGRRCLVTGANAGIGLAAAEQLAELGAEVVLLCRSQERGERAAHRIRSRIQGARVCIELVDVSNPASIRTWAERSAGQPVDVLVHNAGVLPPSRILTEEGHELCWATHVYGPHLLTALLRDGLERSPDGRIIWVSSGGMYTRHLSTVDPTWSQRAYDGVAAYADTKRAQVVLAELWAERLRSGGVSVNSMHPGWVDTPGVRTSLPRFFQATRRILRTPEQGADTVVWLAASRRARGLTGQFFFDRRARRTHWFPGTRESDAERETLWDLCQRSMQTG